jgi:hypothetical protein
MNLRTWSLLTWMVECRMGAETDQRDVPHLALTFHADITAGFIPIPYACVMACLGREIVFHYLGPGGGGPRAPTPFRHTEFARSAAGSMGEGKAVLLAKTMGWSCWKKSI